MQLCDISESRHEAASQQQQANWMNCYDVLFMFTSDWIWISLVIFFFFFIYIASTSSVYNHAAFILYRGNNNNQQIVSAVKHQHWNWNPNKYGCLVSASSVSLNLNFVDIVSYCQYFTVAEKTHTNRQNIGKLRTYLLSFDNMCAANTKQPEYAASSTDNAVSTKKWWTRLL